MKSHANYFTIFTLFIILIISSILIIQKADAVLLSDIYAIGGANYTTTFNTVEKYDPVTNTWNTVAPMPIARSNLAAAADKNGNIYAIGGEFEYSPTNIVQKYNPVTNTWSTVAPMPSARFNLAAAVDAVGNIYAIGGGAGVSSNNIVQKYNPVTNTWSTVASMPTPRYNLAATPPLLFGQSTNTSVAEGTVSIIGTCGLSFPNGNTVNYGSLLSNTTSAEKKLNMTNSGSVNATLTVKGGNWKDSGNNSVMLVNRTHYNITSGTYLQKTPLQAFDQLVKNPFIPSVILQTFWQLQTILMNPTFTGSSTQTMNFTVTC